MDRPLNERDGMLLSGWTGGEPTPAQVEAFVAHLESFAAPKRQAYSRNPRGYQKWLDAEHAKRHAARAAAAPPPPPEPDPPPDQPTTFGAVAPGLWHNGYLPIPLRYGDKAPVLARWQVPLRITDEVARRHGDCGCGILTVISPAADVDVRDEDAAADLRILAREMLGDTPLTRVGQPPKFAALYRTTRRFPKVTGRWLALPADDQAAEDYTPHRVEVLGDGQQLVTHAIHPSTGRPYAWGPEDPLHVAIGELPAIDHAAATAFVDAAEALLVERHGATPVRMRRREWARDDRPRGQRRVRDPRNWWWMHAFPFDHLVDLLELGTDGSHTLDGKHRRWSQSSLAMQCPNHRGAHGNSLNFAQAPDGTVLFHCYAGCDPEDVAEAISDLLMEQMADDIARALEPCR